MDEMREQVKECEGGGITENGAGQDEDDEDREIEGLIFQKRMLVPVIRTSELIIKIMTHLGLMVEIKLLHDL